MQNLELLSIRIFQILFKLYSLSLIQCLLRYLGSNFGDKVGPLSIDYHNFKLILNELKVLLVHHFLVNKVLHNVSLESSKIIHYLLSFNIFQAGKLLLRNAYSMRQTINPLSFDSILFPIVNIFVLF